MAACLGHEHHSPAFDHVEHILSPLRGLFVQPTVDRLCILCGLQQPGNAVPYARLSLLPRTIPLAKELRRSQLPNRPPYELL